MYALNPIYSLDTSVDLPTCMYSLPVLQVSKSIGGDGDNCPSGTLEALEARQEAILTKLGHIRDEVAKYRQSAGLPSVPSPPATASPQGVSPDIVVRCSPSNPPFSLPGLVSILSNHLSVYCSVHCHSCVPSLPSHLHFFLPNPTVERGRADVKVTLIWKEVGNDCELMVSPISQSVIKGEVNILRYFARSFPSLFPYENNRSATAVDNLLDSVTSLLWALPKDRQPILRPLAVNLAKSSFLCGESIGITDLALFSALKQLTLDRDLQPELRKWFTLVSTKLMGGKGRRRSRVSSTRKSFNRRRNSERRPSERKNSERAAAHSERKNSERTPATSGRKNSERSGAAEKKEKTPVREAKKSSRSPQKEVKGGDASSPKKCLKTAE